MQVGGPADLFLEVQNSAALGGMLAELREAKVGFNVLGLGSNILFPDKGVSEAVLRFEGEFKKYQVSGNRVRVGAAMPLAQLARKMATRGLVGLEALSGFPSTVGGAVVMNAGCYGVEIKDLLVTAEMMTATGQAVSRQASELEPGYRSTNLQGTRSIVTAATLQLKPGDAQAALVEIDLLNRRRRISLPSGLPNSGSIFKNPPDDFAGRLIEECGLKGVACGAAQVSPKHANVIVNRGGAKAAEVLELMVTIHRAVKERFDLSLEPELVLVGDLRARWDEAVLC
jgi:UDP-N-acetylmuramate dehydrogenase